MFPLFKDLFFVKIYFIIMLPTYKNHFLKNKNPKNFAVHLIIFTFLKLLYSWKNVFKSCLLLLFTIIYYWNNQVTRSILCSFLLQQRFHGAKRRSRKSEQLERPFFLSHFLQTCIIRIYEYWSFKTERTRHNLHVKNTKLKISRPIKIILIFFKQETPHCIQFSKSFGPIP